MGVKNMVICKKVVSKGLCKESSLSFIFRYIIELSHEKICFLQMQKQRRRSAALSSPT